ncbi:hypothetical protein MKW92_048654 [Papaver armeniacum]|nr:hypothetical protein MKW92_048654 [Papaver armeniacum]
MGLFLLQVLRLFCLILILSQVFYGRTTLARRSLSEEVREGYFPGPHQGRPHDKPIIKSSDSSSSPRSRLYHEEYRGGRGSQRP